jgi:hypothetical protein
VFSATVKGERVRARVGLGGLSKEYWTPWGAGLPGVSGGSNGTSAWVGAEYAPVRSTRLRIETRLTGRPWRSYHRELPDVRQRTTLGAETRVGGLGTLDVETRSGVESPPEPAGDEGDIDQSSDARPVSTRFRVSLRTEGQAPFTLACVKCVSRGPGGRGELYSLSARCDVGLGDTSLLSVGVASTTTDGSVPQVVQYEPALPGEFSLRSLNASGTRWYIRLKAGVSGSAGVSARVSGGPERGEYALGVSVDLKG